MKKGQFETYHFLKNQPKKRQFEIFDLADYQKQNAEHLVQPHAHSFYQIIWFKSKEGTHHIDFKNFDIKANRVFFIAKNQVHYFEKRADYQGVLLHFNESFLLSNETDIDFFLTYSIFNNKKMPYFQITNELEAKITRYFLQIEEEIPNVSGFGNSRILSNLLKSLLLLVEREKTKGINPHQAPDSNFLKFRELLENNFHKNWSVSDFARELSISTKTLNAMVKAQIDTTVSQAISDRIILEAKRKLAHSNAYISQIGYDLGFNDPYYFTKFFKKKVKCSPSEFRNSIS